MSDGGSSDPVTVATMTLSNYLRGLSRLLFAFGCCVLTGCSGATRPPLPPIVVQVSGRADSCAVEAEGRKFTIEELMKIAPSWKGRLVRVAPIGDAPFKCVGSAVFILQRAGFSDVGFPADPSKPGRPKE
jgi:hypothetical protein